MINSILSLEPSKDSEHPENLIAKGDYSAVSSAAIYGANASGKSSLFKAITISLIMIRNSNNVQVTDKLPVVPFKLDFESRNKPTLFEFTFIAKDGKKYIYGFSATTVNIRCQVKMNLNINEYGKSQFVEVKWIRILYHTQHGNVSII